MHQVFTVVATTALLIAGTAMAEGVDYTRDVQPILAANCLSCHGPDAAERQAGLQLHVFEGATARLPSGNTAIVPNQSDQSELIARVAAEDDAVRMPPSKTGKRLSAEQIDILRRWIDSGARYAEHWSFRPLTRPSLPELNPTDAQWVRTPVDVFIISQLRARGLSPSPEADRRTLIRRLYYDLIGLPPSPEQIAAFVDSRDPDAYEKLVETLLASPRYGERWARHWLDVVHYADTHGFDKDKVRHNAWPYRDYVIRSFNEDKRYDRFVLEQLAGDVLFPESPDGVVATGFIVAGPWDFVGHVELVEGTLQKAVTRNLDRDDMVANTMNTFVSLTAQCARCHDHKFDPISIEEYYQLQAVFAAVDRADRPYRTDVTEQREQLVSKRDAIERTLAELDARMEELGGERLATLDAELRLLAAREANGERGYHSAIAISPDRVKWVQVDLGEPVPISQIVLTPVYDPFNNIGEDFGFPLRYRVEVSNDSSFASDVMVLADYSEADVARPKMKPQAIPGNGVRARFVRVTATTLAPRSNDYIFALAELDVVDTMAVNRALSAKVTSLDSIERPTAWSMSNLVDGKVDARVLADKLTVLRERRRALALSTLSEAERARYIELMREHDVVEREIASLSEQPMVFAAATSFSRQGRFAPTGGVPRAVHVLNRGNEANPGQEVAPGAPRIGNIPESFNLSENHAEGDRRVALAQWIVHPENPLTWRSIVNRVWQYHFGQGIVDTPNDFGRMGALPTHPLLLDYLAAEFRDGGQSLKDLHRVIVNSAAYRQSSAHDPEKAKRDTGNRYLWRQNRRRLEAEAIHDAVLQLAGKLDLSMYGPGYYNFVFKDDHSPGYDYIRFDPDDPTSHRRSIYRLIVRSAPDTFMETLDCADPSQSVPTRLESFTPLQALALLNNRFMVRMSEHFAAQARTMGSDLRSQLHAAFFSAVGRPPEDNELDMLEGFARRHGLSNACRLILNLNEFAFVD